MLVHLLVLLIVSWGLAGSVQGAEETRAAPRTSQFRLGPEDVLEISVWRDEALTKQVVVRPDGMISFPLIGDILAKGQTVEELRQAVEKEIKAFVPDAPVTVMLLQLGSPKIYVVGKVAKPGVYLMGHNLTVLQALAMAGGMTPFADKDDILILRKENGQQKTMKFNYGRVSAGKELEQNIVLRARDTIVVP